MKVPINILLLIIIHSCYFLPKKYSRNVMFFEKTIACELAMAVANEDLNKIEELVSQDSTLMEFSNPTSGSNVLTLALYTESYESFKKLLELGANPNFINPYTQKSALIESIKFYEKPNPYTIDRRYLKLLLEYDANPNYAIENNFTNEKGHRQLATSPLIEASMLDLQIVKLLINYGANPYKKIEKNQSTPFSGALSGFKNKFEIINYYIDSLNVDVHEPVEIVNNKKPLYIQYYIKNFMSYNKDSESYIKRQKLIDKLKNMNVDFSNDDFN